jgi:hypothetical protein
MVWIDGDPSDMETAHPSSPTDTQRAVSFSLLYSSAVERAARPWGVGWRELSVNQRRAFILAEVAYMIDSMVEANQIQMDTVATFVRFAVQRVSTIKR